MGSHSGAGAGLRREHEHASEPLKGVLERAFRARRASFQTMSLRTPDLNILHTRSLRTCDRSALFLSSRSITPNIGLRDEQMCEKGEGDVRERGGLT